MTREHERTREDTRSWAARACYYVRSNNVVLFLQLRTHVRTTYYVPTTIKGGGSASSPHAVRSAWPTGRSPASRQPPRCAPPEPLLRLHARQQPAGPAGLQAVLPPCSAPPVLLRLRVFCGPSFECGGRGVAPGPVQGGGREAMRRACAVGGRCGLGGGIRHANKYAASCGHCWHCLPAGPCMAWARPRTDTTAAMRKLNQDDCITAYNKSINLMLLDVMTA